jgi:uncharacterized protein YecE (DUF72 family)
VGIGGWTYAPWRGDFYPADLMQRRELEYASRKVTSIEINGTYYGSQKPATFAKWRDEAPDDFIFSVKGPRFTTNRRVLGEAGQSVMRFLNGGVLELREKLGPINWQFPPTKHYDPDDFQAFLDLLPPELKGRPLRHVIEARHDSFNTPQFIDQLRSRGIATVFTDKEDVPNLRDVTAAFVYIRLHRSSESYTAGYPPKQLKAWAERSAQWSQGESPADVKLIEPGKMPQAASREVFVYAIDGFKQKAPFAAMALIDRLQSLPGKR